APLLALGDHFLDRRLDGIEEGCLGRFLARLGCFRRVRRLTRHLCPALSSNTHATTAVTRPLRRASIVPRQFPCSPIGFSPPDQPTSPPAAPSSSIFCSSNGCSRVHVSLVVSAARSRTASAICVAR